jgi:ubiquinone/menaquinone biosynthesis C-methylase UbiE
MNRAIDYGTDAPGLLRGFFIGFFTFLLLSTLWLWFFRDSGIWHFAIAVIPAFFTVYLLGMGILMLYEGKITKFFDAQLLIEGLPWNGNEKVLDVGCGRGPLLILSARKLTTGRVTGIDVWNQADQANNTAEATLENARIAGVSDKIEVQTLDVRNLPFENQSFDRVVSNWVIHNIEHRSDRMKALDEMIRVVKPGGDIVIRDISNHDEYLKHFRDLGFSNIQFVEKPIKNKILRVVSFGSFAPATVIAQR